MNSFEQMNQAMEYIESNLLSCVDFAAAAEIAGCSEYHFRRIFSYLAGMPPGEYVRLRKLSCAAEILRSSEILISDLSQKLGYESADAFTKAFQSFHGLPPSKARNIEAGVKTFTPITFQIAMKGGTKMNYRIVQKEAFDIIGFKKRVTLQFSGVNTQMESVYEKLTPEIVSELKGLCNTDPAGIINVSANFEDRILEGSALDQYIGTAVSKPYGNAGKSRFDLSGFDILCVPPYTWAVFSVCGKFPEALQETWARIYSEWLPESGYELCDGPEILWNEGPNMTKEDYKSEIWIPVLKK
ncbi:HTH-type transcriptional activator RhaR [Methanimicrococcus sp. At1]|uniref:HTH-type transcriptional activator RhaR n=1 Tax=Methanimicrococcus hacksteinii TaxID=3028293 RepID=A0ABU3VR32_9EURY|nr:AraC family transcriptional regulator [Methanimicrococcus sp. At1]MDV0445872.1 HTH-type transcriptional activator RhaR [Methanimicrococcus sp. At1]